MSVDKHIYVNSFFYADDLVLTAIFISDFQELVDICVTELKCIRMKMNLSKLDCWRIVNRHLNLVENLVVNDVGIEWKKEIRYSGVFITSATLLHPLG